jgi:hypothetical protein
MVQPDGFAERGALGTQPPEIGRMRGIAANIQPALPVRA